MDSLKLIVSASIGLTAGLALGYLTAPNSGTKTRKKITAEVNSQLKALEENMNNKVSEVKNTYNDQVNKIGDTGKTAIDRAKDLVSVN